MHARGLGTDDKWEQIDFQGITPLPAREIVYLPKQDAPSIAAESDEPLVLTLSTDRIIYLGDEPIHLELLGDRLGAALAGQPHPVFIKADENLPYGFVIKVLAILDKIGVEQIGMVTVPEDR